MTKISCQNILLWRHAEALPIGIDIPDDLSRPLSKKGQQQANKMARWLKDHLPNDTIILSSYAIRSQQTAQALSNAFKRYEGIAPGASLTDVLKTIDSATLHQPESNVLIIGHQPWLGELAAFLLDPHTDSLGLSIKKAALWWFKRSQGTLYDGYRLITVQTPSLL